jgi:hypothetical protein
MKHKPLNIFSFRAAMMLALVIMTHFASVTESQARKGLIYYMPASNVTVTASLNESTPATSGYCGQPARCLTTVVELTAGNKIGHLFATIIQLVLKQPVFAVEAFRFCGKR